MDVNLASSPSTFRDSSRRDLRPCSSDLAQVGSSDTLSPFINRDKDSDSGQILTREIYGGSEPCFQSGILRTNCIDCLDRTNVAQYAYGLAALGRQLHAMGLTDSPKVDPDSSLAAALMDMYQGMGDALAQQYGGSDAHNTVFPDKQGKWKATTQSQEFLKSIKRYYSNTYTDGEKQDAINLFLGYFKPQEGKPALWDLDSDYYLHVSGVGDELIPVQSSSGDAMPVEVDAGFHPIPACKEDFSRMKLTSFDKLIERTCSAIKNVRLCREPDHKSIGGGGGGVAPDAVEIQLKSPNWLFGQRKYEVNDNNALKAASCADANGQKETGEDNLFDLMLLSPDDHIIEEVIVQRYLSMTSVNEENGWYGGTLLGDQDENSEIYKHYADLCQGLSAEPFESDAETNNYYADVLRIGMVENMDDEAVEAEMEAALNEYNQIGAHLGILPSCKSLAGDPSQLTRWIIGEHKIYTT